jgi:ribose 1,5-bisphosphate isomerase
MIITQRIREARNHFQDASDKISIIGSKKIKKGFVVFTHCHSSTVLDLLKFAHHKKINFEVHNTETRPLFQGRKTAAELCRSGIKVKHYIDSAARIALKKADICLFGADAITSEGNIINKIGTELFIEIADKYEIPVYMCADSWKFDPDTVFGKDTPIENRHTDEVWPKAPKGLKIINPAFELIPPDMVSGIISELGIFHPDVFSEEVKRRYPWICSKLI